MTERETRWKPGDLAILKYPLRHVGTIVRLGNAGKDYFSCAGFFIADVIFRPEGWFDHLGPPIWVRPQQLRPASPLKMLALTAWRPEESCDLCQRHAYPLVKHSDRRACVTCHREDRRGV